MADERSWTDDDLATDWIRRFTRDRRLIVSVARSEFDAAASREVEEKTFWAFEVLHDLTLRDPARAWAVILQILRRAPEDEGVRDNLAAGPVENLLRLHGDKIISQIELEAQTNPRFQDLLVGVWQSGISDSVWQRVVRAAVPADGAGSRVSRV